MKKISYICIFLLVFFNSLAQNKQIQGFVKSKKDFLPLIGVSISTENKTGTLTDSEGNFKLHLDNTTKNIIVSYIGYKTQVISVLNTNDLEIYLIPDDKQLDEVVVQGFSNIDSRARKRVENIQSIPESVVAVTAKEIELTSIKNIGSLLTQIPGITYTESQDPGTVMISVRGIPQIRYGASPIATIVDGVYYSSPDLVAQNFFDIDQIEVIKGSQGLFYGKNAIGGAVIMTSKQPKNELGGRVKVGYGNGNTANLEAGISGPIVNDKVYFRLGGSYLKSDGLIKNTFLDKFVDSRNNASLKGQLRFNLSDKTTLTFDGQVNNNKGGAVTFVSSALNPDFKGANPNSFGGTPNADDLGKGTLKNNIFSMSFETNFKDTRLTSYTSLANVKLNYTGDYLSFAPIDNYGPIPAVTQEMTRNSKTFNEELRLTSTKKDTKFKWTIGAFYQNINSIWNTDLFANVDPEDFNYKNTTKASVTADENTLSSIGLFGFFDYNLTDKLVATVGVRNEFEKIGNTENVGNTKSNHSYSAFQPKLALNYKFAKENMVYVSYSQGFRSGGFNPEAIAESGINKIILPEYTKSIELGTKNSFWNNRIILNAAVFSSIYQNQQIYRFAATTVRSILGTINYDESKIKGIEVDGKIRLSKHFDFMAGMSLLHTEITKAFDSSAVGNKIPFAPQSSWNLGLNSNFKVSPKSILNANINVENKGKKYWFADDLYSVDQKTVFQNPYTLVNAKVALDINKITVALWAKNIFNTQYNQEWWPFGVFDGDPIGGPLGDIRTPSQPATYGIELNFRF